LFYWRALERWRSEDVIVLMRRGEEARRRRLGVLRMWWFILPLWILSFLFFVFRFVL
jgi:hypothetical protein